MNKLFEYDSKESEIIIYDKPYSFSVDIDVFFAEVEKLRKEIAGNYDQSE